MAIVSSDGGRGGSATIFRAEALGGGLALRTP
jgi:hypothetical protein